ncbi:MAG: type II secretion system F family protein [Gammaproteobacteria bacterium]
MEYLLEISTRIMGEKENARIFLALVFGVVSVLFLMGLFFVISGLKNPLDKRLDSIKNTQGNDTSKNDPGMIAKAVGPMQSYVLPGKEVEKSKMEAKLLQAGYRSSSAVKTFYGVKLILALFFGGATLLIATLFPKFTVIEVVYGVLAASFIGVTLPNIVLKSKIEKRHLAIMNGFPDALDLLVICTEAGLGLNAALQRVADELGISYPELMEELEIVNAEIRMGVDRVAALRGLADRTGIEEIRGLVTLLTQSLRFGTSIAETLRIYSEEFRDKRAQKAEEEAAKIATKMIFPLVFCMFPAFFIVAIGPAILGVIRALKG